MPEPKLAHVAVFLGKVRYKIKLFLLDAALRPERPADMQRFGSYYGGWWIPAVNAPGSVALCVGAGTDVTFDLELLRLGYVVHTVDPTPAAIDFVRKHSPELNLITIGIWDSEGEVSFEQDSAWSESWMVGRSAPRAAKSGVTRSFPVTTVRGLMRTLGDPDVSVLKLDIEGAEHDVIVSLIRDRVRPATVCVEFDDQRLRRILRSVARMRAYRYRLLQIENYNFTFVRL